MLITLVIIGVIAALTIPNLMQKYTEQTTVKKVQKFYSNLSNTYSLAMKENGPVNEWGLTGSNAESEEIIYEKLFKPNFKIVQACGFSNTESCAKKATHHYKDLNSDVASGGVLYNQVLILSDGETVFLRDVSSEIVYIYFDINGIKEPNQWGRDLFAFGLKNDKVYPWGIKFGEYSSYNFDDYCANTTTTGRGCAAWVIYKGNMDYLHCDGLTWQSHSCKDK